MLGRARGVNFKPQKQPFDCRGEKCSHTRARAFHHTPETALPNRRGRAVFHRSSIAYRSRNLRRENRTRSRAKNANSVRESSPHLARDSDRQICRVDTCPGREASRLHTARLNARFKVSVCRAHPRGKIGSGERAFSWQQSWLSNGRHVARIGRLTRALFLPAIQRHFRTVEPALQTGKLDVDSKRQFGGSQRPPGSGK